VVLVRPAHAETSVKAAMVRVRGELIADGFDVAMVEAEPGASSAVAMTAAERANDSATVGLSISPDGESAELWVLDQLSHKAVVRRVNASSEPSDTTNQVLAVRTVELLRASLLELVLELARPVTPPPAPAPPDVAHPMGPKTTPPISTQLPRSLAFELGPGVVLNPGQVDPAFVIVARLQLLMGGPFHARLSFLGFGTRPEVIGLDGAAQVQQFWGLFETVFAPWQTGRSTPMVSVGMGALNVRAEGTAASPYQGLQGNAWGLVADAGAGWSVRFSPRLSLSAEIHIALSAPYPVVRQLGRDLARIGNPSILSSLTVAGWL
jgi:hypothetical protein